MKKIILYILFYFILIAVSKTQSLDELIIEAIDNNLELKILEKEYLAALEKAPQVSQLPDPEIGVGAFPLPVETRLGAQIIRIGATQMLPWKGLLDGKENLEIAKAKALHEKVRANALEVSFQVKQAYFLLYEIEKSQSIIHRNLKLLEALNQLALVKVESGKATMADVLRVQLKTEELKQELKILKLAETKPKAIINQLLNRSQQSPVIVVDSFSFAVLPFEKAALIADIENSHPTLRMFELQQEVAQQAIKLNDLSNKPSFGVGLDYIMVNQRKDAEPVHNGRDILQVRASVKIPIYKKKYEAKEREENFKIAVLADKKTDLLNRFSASIEQAYVDYQTAQLRSDLYQQQIEITKATINILQTNYSSMGSGFDELLRLEKELIEYDLKMLKVIVQSHLAKSEIERFFINNFEPSSK